MSHYVYAPKADSNHAEIIGFYEELFCSVLDLHKVGGGAPDLLVGCAGRSELSKLSPKLASYGRIRYCSTSYGAATRWYWCAPALM